MYVFKKIRKTVSYFEDNELLEILDNIEEKDKISEFEQIALEDAEQEEKEGYYNWLEELYNVWESPMARLEDYTRYGHLDTIIRKGGELIKA